MGAVNARGEIVQWSVEDSKEIWVRKREKGYMRTWAMETRARRSPLIWFKRRYQGSWDFGGGCVVDIIVSSIVCMCTNVNMVAVEKLRKKKALKK
jgi:hypothetical protein